MTTYSPPAQRAAHGRSGLLAALATLACLALPLAAGAAEQAQPVKPDATAGAAKAAICTACHGPNGNSINPEWPSLAGQNARYITEQVKLFRAGHRKNELMYPIALTLSDQDIADVAAHFSTQTPTGQEADPALWKAGEKLYRGGDPARGIPGCIACHGPVGRGVPAAGYPALRAQYAVYTQKQLAAYATGERYQKDEKGASLGGPNSPMMAVIASRLTEDDRSKLAAYIQGLR